MTPTSKIQTFKHSIGFFSDLNGTPVYLKSFKDEATSLSQFEAESEFYLNYNGSTSNILMRIDQCRVEEQVFHILPAINHDLVGCIGQIEPARLVCEIILPILKALKNMHAQGWIHGDLKLENIRVQNKEQFEVFISDFGKVVKMGKHCPHRIGALSQHLAPDQTISPQLDIYAVGVMAFQLLFGFDFIKRFQMAGRSFLNIPEAKSVSPELLEFIRLATEPSAAHRIKTASHAISCLIEKEQTPEVILEKYNLDFYFEYYLECLRNTFIESGRSGQDFEDYIGPFGEKYYQRLQKWQAEENALVVHLKSGHDIVGICEAKVKTDYGMISAIMVISTHQKKGFGRLLESAALEFFKKLNLKHCVLNVTQTNIKAIAFYQKQGWCIDNNSSNYQGAHQMFKAIN